MNIWSFFGGSILDKDHSTVAFHLSSSYGWVILVAVASAFLLVWMSLQVGKYRKQYKIFYPTMYSADNNHFNCVQRVHQNTLEYYSTFLFLLFVGGLEMPLWTAVAGVIWICGRISYAFGYYTGDPKKRMRGAYAYIGLIMMTIATVKLGVRMIIN